MPSWQQVKDSARRLGLATLALVSFAAPFAVSLAANITAGLHSGSQVLLVAGVAIPVLLMLAIELWRRLPPVNGGCARFFRGLAMAAPVAVAAGWSWMDTTGLLLAQYPSEGPGSPSTVQWLLCFTAPLAVDGLAVLAVLARDVPTQVGAESRPPNEEAGPVGPPVDGWGPAAAVDTPCSSSATSRTPVRDTSQETTTVTTPSLRAVPARRSPGVPAVPGWTRDTARARCAELGVSQRGTVAQLVERIDVAERERAGVPA